MICASTFSTHSDPFEAVRELLAALEADLGERPSWVVLVHDVSIPGAEICNAWKALAPDLPLHRATSCRGLMGDFGFQAGPVVAAFALRDAGGAYGSAAASLESDVAAGTRAALERAIAQADRLGEAPDLLFVSASPGNEEQVIATIQSELGETVPIAGGSAADDTIEGNWSVGDAESCHGTGVVISALFTSTPPSFVFSSGYTLAGFSGVVTSATGRVVHEIDGKAASEVYNAWTGGVVDKAIANGGGEVLTVTTLHPVGRRVHDGSNEHFILSHPNEVLPDGSLSFMTCWEKGQRIELMQGSIKNLVARAGRLIEGAFDREGKIQGGLLVYCAGCMLAVGEQIDEVSPMVSRALQAPFLGIFTFGEQGCPAGLENFHGNLMISIVAFHG